ncbi:MAG: cellulase family glycosylhydrolase, partial [Bacteroidetes bacterium]|nr:cellulase family glycosylhydrolase [Bacteroidota bacterium]
MKTIIFVTACFFFIALQASGQQNPFIYFKDGKFKKGCDDFYPLVMNYNPNIQKVDGANEYYLASNFMCEGHNCGFTKAQRQQKLIADLRKIESLGFNTVRLTLGLGNYQGNMSIAYWGEPYILDHIIDLHTKSCNPPPLIIHPGNYDIMFSCIHWLIDTMETAGVDLKIILLTGHEHIDSIGTAYSGYLSALAAEFRDEPAIFAYDIFNEPNWHHLRYDTIPETAKNIWYNEVMGWYTTIRSNDPNHFITVGLWDGAVNSGFDPAATPVDFLSLHPYYKLSEKDNYNYANCQARWNSKIYWFSQVCQKPWIIGETTYSACDANDSVIIQHPGYVGTEDDQRRFIDSSLQFSRGCGASGYSWWVFQDGLYPPYNGGIVPVELEGRFQGLYYADHPYWNPGYDTAGFHWDNDYWYNELFDNRLAKVATQGANNPFLSFDPSQQYACPLPSLPDNPDVYYDPLNYSQNEPQNYVEGAVTVNGQPVANAMVGAWRDEIIGYDIENKPKWKVFYYSTYTKADGTYKLYFDSLPSSCSRQSWPDIDSNFIGLSISAYGKTWHHPYTCHPNNSNYGTIDLQYLNFDPTTTDPDYYNYVVAAGAAQTFTGPVSFTGDVVVEQGATLTIKSDAFFTENAKLIVKPGGKLIVDGGRLTANCGEMWAGVRVLGNPDVQQTPDGQGTVILGNYAVVENSETGVWVESGGILKCYGNSLFKNNHIAIRFDNYSFTNLSDVRECHFETDDALIAGTDPHIFIYLTGVKGVKIKGNTFINNLTNNNIRVYGIFGIGSQFYVDDYCSALIPYGGTCPAQYTVQSSFTNLQIGILGWSYNNLSSVSICNTDFNNNRSGISLCGVNYCKIKNNNFNTSATTEDSYGFYIYGCSGYTIENNNFNSGDYGGYIYKSGSSVNEIYKNTF